MGESNMKFYGNCGIASDSEYKLVKLKPRVSGKFFRFVFVVESSCCRDFIGKTVWKNALYFEAIPVIIGPPRSSYEKVLPKNSFIHVDDFKTVYDLMDWLMHLSQNADDYGKYFEWRNKKDLRNSYGVPLDDISPKNFGWCRLVKDLVEGEFPKQADFDKYLDHSKCECNTDIKLSF